MRSLYLISILTATQVVVCLNTKHGVLKHGQRERAGKIAHVAILTRAKQKFDFLHGFSGREMLLNYQTVSVQHRAEQGGASLFRF